MAEAPSNRVRSFEDSASNVVTTSKGAKAHALLVNHMQHLQRRLVTLRPGVWCLIGNGLSNQSFVEGPDGIIAIDTGECVEEMRSALKELRTVTTRPIVAVIYTHFHYVNGTKAIFEEVGHAVPIYAHSWVVANRLRVSDEIGPFYTRGLVEQFGVGLPSDGPDGLVHAGLGLALRFPQHAPFTPGFEAPTHTTLSPVTWKIAGLTVEVLPAPSDSNDSLTVWFPELGVAAQNLVWPTLFNIFAIRGEEYRDPRGLLSGLDDLLRLNADFIVGTHGPEIQGRDTISSRVQRYRDSIQFLWDQTVRGMNKGWSADELASRVRLPALFDDDFITSERYGVAEHHVRQIHNGLKGWFDGDPAKLFPLEPHERAKRLIAGFGGHAKVRAQATSALDANDLRWAIELAAWLVKAPAGNEPDSIADRNLLAAGLRRVGQRSPAANIRNWALTQARDLEGVASLERYRTHRMRRDAVVADPAHSLDVLRVLLDPARAQGLNHHVRFDFGMGKPCGLHVRHAIACPTDGVGAQSTLKLTPASWADLMLGKETLATLLQTAQASVQGDPKAVAAVLAAFDFAPTSKSN